MKHYVTLAFMLLLTACSSTQTKNDYDPNIDFSQFKSFAWVETNSTETSKYHLNGLMDQRIKSAVDKNLISKEMTQVDKADADLLVNYLTKVEKRVSVDDFNTQFGYYPYHGRYAVAPVMNPPPMVNEYKVGTLFIDLVNNKTGHLVWRGSIEKILDEDNNLTPDQRTEKINEAVTKILSQYPPQVKADK